MNATMNISVPNTTAGLAGDIAHISAQIVVDHGLSGMTVPTFSAVKGELEHGATVSVYGATTYEIIRLFRDLKRRWDLGCCWIVVSDDSGTVYEGCILKWDAFPKPFPRDPGSPTGPDRSEMVRRAYR